MKKYSAVIFGIGMAILWSAVFVQVLHGPAGIAVGVCFGIAFGASMAVSARKNSTKDETQGHSGPGKDE